MKKGVLLALMLCLAQICIAQKEGNTWYFGKNAGLNFNTNPPTPLAGTLNTLEGSASISHPVTGEILMYTDGITIWDRNHNQMPSNVANPLKGHTSSTQSALIVPQPGSNTRYYIFTTVAQAGGSPPSLCYSIVDLSLNGGTGDLVSWNNVLLDTTTEKLAGVGNCERSAFWIVGHKWNCDSFYAFRLTNTGIAAPVKSKTGIVHTDPAAITNGEAAGYMKFSPDGRKLGLVTAGESNVVEFFDFDFNTRMVSNPITDPITFPTAHPLNELYGCSFSPDGSKFYVSSYFFPLSRKVFQYDMNGGSAAAILASRVDVAVQSDTNRITAALQNGPDGKMYVVTVMGNSLDVIHNPNQAGAACNYQPKALYYNGGEGRLGLPSIVESFLSPPPKPVFNLPQQLLLCKGDTLWAPQSTKGSFSIIPASGFSANADTTLLAFYPDTTTTYTVVITSPCHINDTVVFTLKVSAGPVADFVFSPEDLLPTDPFLILDNTSTNAQTYAWYDNDLVFQSSDIDYKLPHPGLGTFCYMLVAKDTAGCADSVSKCIDITKDGLVFIPNTFSPNGDGLNDVFRIYGIYRRLDEFSVFNRYGERVFSTTNMSAGWDGLYKTKRCDAGTYYYLVKLVDGKGRRELRKGDINLVY